MRKTVFVPLALVLVVIAVATSPKKLGACGPYCDSPGGYTSPPATAIGTSCALATSSLSTQLKSYANSSCGSNSCSMTVFTTVACHAVSGGYSVTGYATFGCRDSTC